MTPPAAGRRGRFVTFEGGEGAGKSTQGARLAAWLGSCGIEVVRTREPGGTTGAEEVRALVVTGATGRWSPLAEALLMFAARSDHLDRLIRPALARGAWVVCDRFADSTMAYQGYAHGLGRGAIEGLDALVTGGTRPDLTLVLDLPPALGLARATRRGDGRSRFEALDPGFHDRLRDAYLDIARREPRRCVVIDAEGDADSVAEAVRAAVSARLPEVDRGPA